MTYHPQVAPNVRTVNWNNMNFFRRTVTRELSDKELEDRSEWQQKIRKVKRVLKRYGFFDTKRTVIVSSRRMGKTTMMHRLHAEVTSLVALREALVNRDREAIKLIINQRINARGKYNGVRSDQRTFENSPFNLRV